MCPPDPADKDGMAADLRSILKLEVPVIVLIGDRTMPMQEVVNLSPGAIIELPKPADDELNVLVNNKAIGFGRAVKVGENFGVRLTYVGDVARRIQAMTEAAATAETDAATEDDLSGVALAEQLVAGQ
jgi:flagellar motor switch protein FliN/FliY